MGRYIKYNKDVGSQLKTDLNTAFEDLKTTLSDIETYCVNRKTVSRDKIYHDHSVWNAIGEFFERVVDWDWSDDYEQFKKILDQIKGENTNKKNTELNSDLAHLKKAMEGLDQLINEFDVGTAFNLSESYEGNNNVTIKAGSDGTSVIYYLDADGREVSLQELTNAFYTYTGMTMDAQLKGFLTAQQNGVAFDAKYQQNIMDGVNANVGAIQSVGGFGVASEQDIIGVDTYLSEDINYKSMLAYDGEQKLARNTGATTANNMSVGSNVLSEYTMTDYINGNPIDGSGDVDGGGSPSYSPGSGGGGGGYNPSSETEPSGPTEKPLPGTNEEGTNPDPGTEDTGKDDTGVDDTTTDTGTDDTNVDNPDGLIGDTGLTQEEVDTYSKEIDTIADAEDYENVEINTKDDYDDLAREKYESMDPEEMAERRGNIAAEAEELFAQEDKTALRNKLKEYGYDERDIDKIVQSEDATISAMMEGDQRMTMSEYAKEFAEKDGVEDFDSKFDDEQGYRNYNEDSSSGIIANRSNDPEVKEAREEYVEAKEEYETAADNVNTSVNNVNDSKDEIEQFKKDNGSDVSKWTKDQVTEYRDKVEKHNENVEDLNKKQEVLTEKETKYTEAKENYEEAKDNFDKRIRGENVDDDYELSEREKEKNVVDVPVEDKDLLPDDTTTKAAETSGEATSTEIKYEEQNSSTVDTSQDTKSEEPILPTVDETESTTNQTPVEKTEEVPAPAGESETTDEITTGVVVEDTGDSGNIEMDQGDLLNLAGGAEDVSQTAAPETLAMSEETSSEPRFSNEAATEPSFNAAKETQSATKSLEGETAQDIEKEIIDNLVVDDSISFNKNSNETVPVDSIVDLGNGQTEMSVGDAALLSQITQTETEESKKEE